MGLKTLSYIRALSRIPQSSMRATGFDTITEIENLKTQIKEERTNAKNANEKAAELKGRLAVLDRKKPPSPRKQTKTPQQLRINNNEHHPI